MGEWRKNMKKCVSLSNLFENGIPFLEFGGTIKFHGESDNDYDLINDTTQEVIIRNDEQLEFGEWCHNETDGKFIVGTSDSGKNVYFSKEEYVLAVAEKQSIELGKEYLFAGYRWVPVKINENWHAAVMQSLGVTAGPWPGFSMENLGDGNHYTHNIDEYDISRYDDKTYALMKQIKPVSLIDGLYLPGLEDINDNQLWKDALAKAASRYSSFGASYCCAWTGTYNGGYDAWIVNSNGNTNYGNRNSSFVVPAAFNLDLSKVEIRDDEIVIRDGEKSQTSQAFGITLVEKPNVDGLTKTEVMEMYDQMDGDEAYPLEISGCESSAMGFITPEAAEILDYDYQESGLNDFVAVILNDMNNESEDGTYKFRGIRIHLSR